MHKTEKTKFDEKNTYTKMTRALQTYFVCFKLNYLSTACEPLSLFTFYTYVNEDKV